MTNSSQAFFERTLRQKTQEAVAAVRACVDAFLSSDPNRRPQATANAQAKVELVLQMLTEQDQPQFLQEMKTCLDRAAGKHEPHQINAIRTIASRLLLQLESHQWDSVQPANGAFDFDRLIRQCESEQRVQDLFDQLVDYLTQLIALDDVIDSNRAMRQLQMLIDLLQKAKSGSHSAKWTTVQFVVRWAQNSGWKYAEDLPVIGPIVSGFNKTLEDCKSAMEASDTAYEAMVLAACSPELQKPLPRLVQLEPNDVAASSALATNVRVIDAECNVSENIDHKV